MDRWVSRVALVTGASTGIGAGISKELVKQGMKVIGCAKNFEAMKQIAESEELTNASGKMHPIQCDLSKEHEIQAMFEKIRNEFGRIDVCINNAGINPRCPLLGDDAGAWRNILEVNVMATNICTKLSVKLMEDNKINDGQIININSVVSLRFPEKHDPGFTMYSASKACLRTVTEGLRKEIRSSSTPHIRVASISPGVVQTPLIEKAIGADMVNALFSHIKVLEPEDIAKTVTFILQTPPHVEVHDIVIQPVEYVI